MVGAYAALRFLGARGEAERAHYDWMGRVGNAVGLAALLPLPFAGYYLGREVYSASPLMGNHMMGGVFSWGFIIQAGLMGMLFVGGHYYLWLGITGAACGSESGVRALRHLGPWGRRVAARADPGAPTTLGGSGALSRTSRVG